MVSEAFLRSFFALPSLQGRDDNIGFGETVIKRICLFAACSAGYRGRGGTVFVRGWWEGDATLMQGWSEEGTALVRGRYGDG